MANNVKVSLTIDSVDTVGKKSSTKIAYVNPGLSDNTMREFANMCAALTTDTHTATTKTTEEDITSGSSVEKPLPYTLEQLITAGMDTDLAADKFKVSNQTGMIMIQPETPGTGVDLDGKVTVTKPFIFLDTENPISFFALSVLSNSDGEIYIAPIKGMSTSAVPEGGLSFDIVISETATTREEIIHISVPTTGNASIEVL